MPSSASFSSSTTPKGEKISKGKNGKPAPDSGLCPPLLWPPKMCTGEKRETARPPAQRTSFAAASLNHGATRGGPCARASIDPARRGTDLCVLAKNPG
ncbi:hypothetical protein psal_cds_1339 [Pandoravirus salinus]|uniref:Uncharacterized protein n=1 Tax=Pandoravirus salinus TaxID=1349410 RepID=S4VZD3_9VIRU|nr:hypothetical protein psal_cds_1339 [Pandoravirus salinus]AGO85728.2 hypothetical protein psal_cds_1339 [Pandoravirus salinus]